MEWKGDILAVGVTEKDMAKDENSKFQNPILQKLDSHLDGLLSEASSEEDFSGKAGQSTILRLPGRGSKRVGLVGLGSAASPTTAYRSLGEAVAAAGRSQHVAHGIFERQVGGGVRGRGPDLASQCLGPDFLVVATR